MFNYIPLDIAETVRSRVFDYSKSIVAGTANPNVNLKTIQQQYTIVLTLRLRKQHPVTTAKRLAKQAMSTYFEYLLEEISK